MSDHEKEKINQELNALRMVADTTNQRMSGLHNAHNCVENLIGTKLCTLNFPVIFARNKNYKTHDK